MCFAVTFDIDRSLSSVVYICSIQFIISLRGEYFFELIQIETGCKNSLFCLEECVWIVVVSRYACLCG